MPTAHPDPDTSIAYTVDGEGPPIVLHPGVSMPGGTFPPWLVEPLVAAGHSVVRIDPRDTGRSTRYDQATIDLDAANAGDLATVPYSHGDLALDAWAVLDDAGLGTATLVGHSMGGSVVAAMAALAPDRVDRLVFLSCGPGFPIEPTAEFLDVMMRPVPRDRAETLAWAVDMAHWTMGPHFDPVVDGAGAEGLVDLFGWLGVPAAHVAAAVAGTPGITVPVLDPARTTIAYGTADEFQFPARALAASLPGCQVVELEGYGHWFPEVSCWDQIVAAVLGAT